MSMSSCVLEDGTQKNKMSNLARDVGDGTRSCLAVSHSAFTSRVCIIDGIFMWRWFARLWTSCCAAACEYSRVRLENHTMSNIVVNTSVL